jgi:hypothetical protein
MAEKISSLKPVGGRSPSPVAAAALTRQALEANDQKLSRSNVAVAAAGSDGGGDVMSRRINKLMKLAREDWRPEMYRVDLTRDADLKALHEQSLRRDPLTNVRPIKASTNSVAQKRNETVQAQVVGTGSALSAHQHTAGSYTRDSDSIGSGQSASRRKHLVGTQVRSNSSGSASSKRMVDVPAARRSHNSMPWDDSPSSGFQRAADSPTIGRQHFPNTANSTTTEEIKHVSSIRIPICKEVSSAPLPGAATPRGGSACGDETRLVSSRGASATALARSSIRTQASIAAAVQRSATPPPVPAQYKSQRGRQMSPHAHIIFPHSPDETLHLDPALGGPGVNAINKNEVPASKIVIGKVVYPGPRVVIPEFDSTGIPTSARIAAKSNPNVLNEQHPAPVYRRAARSVTPPGPNGRRGSSGIFDRQGPSMDSLRAKVTSPQPHHLTSANHCLTAHQSAYKEVIPDRIRRLQVEMQKYPDSLSGGALVDRVTAPQVTYGKRQKDGGFRSAATTEIGLLLSGS